ncbi:MAG TPA: glycosyltransferase [Coriobacteriia bacterium]|jgi:GT2 family glycosyltransferase
MTAGLTDIGAGSVSVGIIAARRIPALERLVAHLVEMDPPPLEILIAVESPGTPRVHEARDERGVRWLEIPAARGLGFNRNRVVEAASGQVLVFVDDDCEPEPDWLQRMLAPFADPLVDAVVGRVRIPPSTFLGDSIAALGFPAGGSAGYETMFEVRDDGTTDNLTTCNCALRMTALSALGGFDEAMVHGGEDTELGLRMRLAERRIVYRPDAVVAHPARTRLDEFARWFFRRGRAKRQFVLRAGNVGGYVGRRLLSYVTIVRSRWRDPRIVAIVALLVASFMLQQVGYAVEWIRPSRPSRRVSD